MGGGAGGMGDMGAMMKTMMGGPQQKELYPSLMALPVVSPEQRQQLQQQAEARAKIGAALLQQGTARLANPEANDLERQEGVADVRAGLQEWESGHAAGRVLAEGRAPRTVALPWLQNEMNLASPSQPDEPNGQLGITPLHLFTMVLLIAFSLAMVVMYFFKMRRAAALFGRLESDKTSPPGTSPPLAGGSGSSPPDGKSPPPPPGGEAANAAEKPVSPDEKLPLLPVAGSSPDSTSAPPTALGTTLISPVVADWRGPLRVGSIVTETPNVKTFRLLPPLNEPFLPFTFVPGQFLNVAFWIGGAKMNRSYSISSSPTQREYVDLTVRREPRGAVSRHFVDLLKVGDLIEAGGPVGRFTFDGTEADSIVLIGGGVGITPMMSITRYLTERSWPGEIFFIYTCRTPADFIFADELTALERLHPTLHVAVTISRAEGTDWKGTRGRITKELLTQTVPNLTLRRIHICGPPSMMDSTRAMLTELGVPQDQVKTEAFGAIKPAPPAPGTTAKPTAPATGPLVTFSKNSKSAKIHVDQTILELSEELGIGIEFSCRVGTCGICKVKMTSGEVDQEVQDALDHNDKTNGIILACQAKPKSEVSVVA